MNYYNEIEPHAAAWLRELIAAKEIPAGVVDERSIVDVQANDLIEYTRAAPKTKTLLGGQRRMQWTRASINQWTPTSREWRATQER